MPFGGRNGSSGLKMILNRTYQCGTGIKELSKSMKVWFWSDKYNNCYKTTGYTIRTCRMSMGKKKTNQDFSSLESDAQTQAHELHTSKLMSANNDIVDKVK